MAPSIAGMRLHMLPLHRLASGLRKINSLIRPEKYSFIHIDGQVEEEEQPDIIKCVSNLLDGVPLRWKQDEVISGHVESIVSAYGRSKSGTGERLESDSPSTPMDVLLGRERISSSSLASESSFNSSNHIAGTSGMAERSVGSENHDTGTCKPCAWNRKAGGCFKGATCEFCHTCDDGAVKRKKSARVARLKEKRRAAKSIQEQDQMPVTPRSDWD